jgi:hypothetical protein
MPPKTPRKHLSLQTQYFAADKQLLLGQLLPARIWLQRHQLPLNDN